MTSSGFRNWVESLLHLKKGGTAFLAPVCSSWSSLCKAQHKRTQASPLGDQKQKFVQIGNGMMLRAIFLAFLTWLGDGDFIVESPLQSVFEHVDFAKNLFEIARSGRHVIWMGSYGSRTGCSHKSNPLHFIRYQVWNDP